MVSGYVKNMDKKVQSLIWLLVGLVAIVAAVSIVASILYGGRYSNGYYGPYGMMGGYGFWMMPIIGAVSLILVVIFIYFLISVLPRSAPQNSAISASTPETIARERYARGEISEDEYSKIINNLKNR